MVRRRTWPTTAVRRRGAAAPNNHPGCPHRGVRPCRVPASGGRPGELRRADRRNHAVAVLTAVRIAVGDDEFNDLAAQLPRDFQPMLEEARRPHMDVRSANDFLSRGVGRTRLDPDAASRAGLAALERSVGTSPTGRSKTSVATCGRRLLRRCLEPGPAPPVRHRKLPAAKFLSLVVHREGSQPGSAHEHTRAVLTTLSEWIPDDRFYAVILELPSASSAGKRAPRIPPSAHARAGGRLCPTPCRSATRIGRGHADTGGAGGLVTDVRFHSPFTRVVSPAPRDRATGTRIRTGHGGSSQPGPTRQPRTRTGPANPARRSGPARGAETRTRSSHPWLLSPSWGAEVTTTPGRTRGPPRRPHPQRSQGATPASPPADQTYRDRAVDGERHGAHHLHPARRGGHPSMPLKVAVTSMLPGATGGPAEKTPANRSAVRGPRQPRTPAPAREQPTSQALQRHLGELAAMVAGTVSLLVTPMTGRAR